MLDLIFRFVVYIISIYIIIISYNNNTLLCLCGFIILIAHLYKDIVNLEKWPLWCEYIGLILGLILIKEGYKIKNKLILIIGMMKIIAHIRQLLYNDDKYYY